MNLYISRYIFNNRKLFIGDLKEKSLDFIIIDNLTLKLKSSSIVTIFLKNKTIKL